MNYADNPSVLEILGYILDWLEYGLIKSHVRLDLLTSSPLASSPPPPQSSVPPMSPTGPHDAPSDPTDGILKLERDNESPKLFEEARRETSSGRIDLIGILKQL